MGSRPSVAAPPFAPAAERRYRWADGEMVNKPTRLVLAGALMFAVGCDPGWAYHVADRSPGALAVLRDQGEVGLLVRAGLSTGMLSVEIDVTNDASVPLVVREAAFRVLDASGRPLPWYWGHPPTQLTGVIDGLARGGAPIVRSVTLEWV